MSSIYGQNLRVVLFGQSHAPAVGVTVDGIPAGELIDRDELYRFLLRRAPGQWEYATARRETDEPEFLSGLVGDRTCGAPVTAVIRNADARPADYESIRSTPRPGHADYTANCRYGGFQDTAGGGHFSGRLTAPLCIAGGICIQLLAREGIDVMARILSVGDVRDESDFVASVSDKAFPTVSEDVGNAMLRCIRDAKEKGDSLGGVIQCRVTGLPAGLGDPMFEGMENRIAAAVFGIPAVKGIEFGAGFAAASMTGSLHNDPFVIRDGRIETETNNCGGILGGITTGMPVVFQVAIKPTPSVAVPQKTVNMQTYTPATIAVTGRHDPCIVPRAVPCVEAAAALAIYDAILARRKDG